MPAMTNTIEVHPFNADARRAWDGVDGAYWAANEAMFDDSLQRYRDRFLQACAIAPTDRVLDIGCGNGQTTRDAGRAAPDGEALGVDLSSAMLAQARQRAREEGLANVRFVHADAQIHDFGAGAFDLAISRTGTMFFGDPVAAFTNIARALCPDGRLVMLVWQTFPQNHWVRDFTEALAAGRDLQAPAPDAPGPFSLADPVRTRSILGAAGFGEVTIDGYEEPMYFGATADDAYRFVRGLSFTDWMLQGLDEAARKGALDALRATIDAHATDEGVLYASAVWVVNAHRRSAQGAA
jgi:ubiquinone/menaquinone biosynthesis C-methylase UbiE